jgi:ketosteroid isomerase-like protein
MSDTDPAEQARPAWLPRDLFPFESHFADEIVGNGDRAFLWVRFTGHGAGSDVPIAMEVAQVLTVEDGKIRRLHAFTDRAEALEAAGLAE